MEKLVRRGDPALLLEWIERRGPDHEFADILDRIVAETRRNWNPPKSGAPGPKRR